MTSQENALFGIYVALILFLLIVTPFAFKTHNENYGSSWSFWIVYIPIWLMIVIPTGTALYNKL